MLIFWDVLMFLEIHDILNREDAIRILFVLFDDRIM